MRNKKILCYRQIIALALSLVMLISLAGCKKEDSPLIDQPMNVVDANDAITKLAEAEADYGYENALSELTEKSTSTINGDSYYRLQQNYQGIPVYGSTVVCATDGDGNVTSITGNVQDIDQNINLTPSITSEQAHESIRAYVTEVLEQADTDITISEPITCIYNGSELAYVYTITMDGSFFETHEVLVGAHDASILEWNTYAASFDTNQDVLEAADVNCEFDDSHNLRLADPSRNHSVHYLDLKTSQEYPMVEDVVGNSDFLATADPDQTASGETHALAHLAQISDFYADVLGRQSYNNQEAPVYLFSCDADLLADQGKSLACPEYGVIMLGAPVNRFSEHLGKAMDLIAHEYAHLVFQTEVGLSQDLDVTSVNEGIADIFGNLIELYVDGEQDPSWPLAEDAGYNKYNMADPMTMDSYGNEEHDNAQILSHSAYLMWNGIDNDGSKKLTVQQLAELWYRAVLMMPSNCNFNDCRQLVELAATSMELSTDQIECVSEAFDTVGITGTAKESFIALYDLALDSTLSVYGGNGALYDNYTLTITGNTTIYGPVVEKVNSSYNRTRTITSAEPCELNLPQGIYEFTISDNANPSATSKFTVCVQNNDGDANLDVFTNFGSTAVKGTISEIKVVNGVETNVPVTNAVVKVYSHTLESIVETIDMSETEGFFEVFLPVGNYSFAVEAEGYISSTTSFEVTADQSEYLEIVLKADTQKQLSAVVTYQDGKKSEEYHFTYNDLGQVIGLVAYRYEDGTAVKWYTQNYEYDGNGNPILTKHIGSRGSVQIYQYQYDYDSEGRITGYSTIEYYEDTPGPSDTYIFSYDDQGRVIERRNEYGSSVEEFSYDDSGNTIYKSTDLYWGDGHFIETTVYDYTYDPLVISTHTSESEEYGNSSSKSISFKPHWNLTIASGTIGDACSFDVDSSGYLLRVVDASGNNVFVCNYQEALTGNSEYMDWYKQVLQTHPEATKHSYTSGGEVREYQYDTTYTLYDIDKDGTPELIVQEDLSNYYVYTMSGSGAALCGKFYWSYADCLYAYDENGLVVHDGGIGSMRLEYLWLYELSNGVLDSSRYIISTEESSDDELYDCLKSFTRITNFCPITDYSLLEGA